MFSASLIVPLLLSMQLMANSERNQFSSCLRTYVNAKIEDRTSVADFDAAFPTVCAQQETAYRTAYVAAARRAGDSPAVAQRDAATEVEDLRTNFKELFHGAQPSSSSGS
ncbi:MAG: hypothetical protein QOI38_1665 [Sphingomonadales bacterium]|jgi:hypothetical protein|nr:hypothetical protein [Sphingomonadales bacterium]